MLGALAGALAMLNSLLGAALNFTATPLPASVVPYLPILILVSPFLGAAFGILGLYIGAIVMDWSGRALGGVGNALTTRAALAWARVPQICFSIVTLLVLGAPESGRRVVPSMPTQRLGRSRGKPVHADAWGRGNHLDLVVHPDAALCGRGASFFGLARTGRFLLPGVILGAIAIVVKIALT